MYKCYGVTANQNCKITASGETGNLYNKIIGENTSF